MKLVQTAAGGVLVTLGLALIVLGKALLIPLVLAVFFWFLINIMADAVHKLSIKGHHLPQAVSFIVGLVVIGGTLTSLGSLISLSVNNVIKAAPGYQANVDTLITKVSGWLRIEDPPELGQLFQQLDLGQFLQTLGGTLASFLGQAGIIMVYVLFLFLEQKYFRPKIERIFANGPQHQKVRRILSRIYTDTKTYIGIKTLTSLLTSLVSFIIMGMVGLDFAIFWAILIFLFNFIPTVGSIAATFFPSILALLQFPNLSPFLVIVIGVTGTQVLVGNILEPRLMGDTLNLSPLVILLSLALWGSLWGIPGAILCVPLTVVLAIIFSNFPSTRPIAMLLSRDGQLQEDD